MVAITERLRRAGTGAPLEALAQYGGEAELYRHAEQVSSSDAFDIAAWMLAGAWDHVSHDRAGHLILAGFQQTPDPMAFARAVDAVLARPQVATALAKGLYEVLLNRATARADAREAYIAVDAIDGALRLTLAGEARPFRLLELLSSVTENEHPVFAAAVARRLGVVYLYMPEQSARQAARDAMLVLTRHPEARGDALYELAASWLADGLESGTARDAETALRNARQAFSEAVTADAGRIDAELYAAALDGVIALVEHRDPSEVDTAAEQVRDLALVRMAWRAPGRLSRWLGDPVTAEQEWWLVTAAFAKAAHALEDDVWVNAADPLEAIARAHRAARTAQLHPVSAPGLPAVVEPRINEAFLATSYRLHQLERWAQELADDPGLSDAAAGLKEVVDYPKGPAGSILSELRAKVEDPERFDALLKDLRSDQQALLERRLETLDGHQSILRNPVEQRLSQDTRAALDGSADYHGETRILFDRITDLTIRFVQDRQDIC